MVRKAIVSSQVQLPIPEVMCISPQKHALQNQTFQRIPTNTYLLHKKPSRNFFRNLTLHKIDNIDYYYVNKDCML